MSAVAAYRAGKAPRAASLNRRTASFWMKPAGPPTCADLEVAVDPAAPLSGRSDQLAMGLAGSLASRPMLCDLISAQAAVLERNVSSEVAARYKRASIAGIAELGRLARRHLPELGEDEAFRLAGPTVMMIGALWPHTQPSAALLAAYEADPALAALRLDFTTTLREVVQVLIAGTLARIDGHPIRTFHAQFSATPRISTAPEGSRPVRSPSM
jgi:Tetracyclin repressor-like, C-terminal domain